MAKNVISNSGRALNLTAKIDTPTLSKNSKQVLSTLPELITFYNIGEGLYIGKLVKSILYKRNKKQKGFTHLHH